MATRRTKLSKELKTAIAMMTGKEKDKLLFRLLPKNPTLVAQLEYKLLEDGDTTELRRRELGEAIEARMLDVIDNFYSPGYLLLDYRHISGRITEHVKTTKDKTGEIELNLLMLSESLPKLTERINGFSAGRCRTLNNYVVRRVLKIFKLLNKFHPDTRLDYQDDLKRIGGAIGDIPTMMKTAIAGGLDVNWLLGHGWPEEL